MATDTEQLSAENALRERQKYVVNVQSIIRKKELEAQKIEERIKSEAGRPSLVRNIGCLGAAVTADIADLVSLILDVAVVGIVLGVADKLVFSPILFINGWIAKGKVDKTAKVHNELLQIMENIQKEMEGHLGARSRLLGKAAQNVHGTNASSFVSKGKANLPKLQSAISRNPFTKNLVAGVIDLIPVIDLLPARTIGLCLTWLDEMSAYGAAQIVVKAYRQTRKDELNFYRQMLREMERTLNTEKSRNFQGFSAEA